MLVFRSITIRSAPPLVLEERGSSRVVEGKALVVEGQAACHLVRGRWGDSLWMSSGSIRFGEHRAQRTCVQCHCRRCPRTTTDRREVNQF